MAVTFQQVRDGLGSLFNMRFVSGSGSNFAKGVVLFKTDADTAVNPATSEQLGEVQASPTANTVLDRLKTIATGLGSVVLAAGTAVIGKVGLQVGGSDVSTTNRLHVADKPRFFSATVTTLTRPANTTAYAQNDSISDNATAGSVTALSCTPSDTNDDPICITELLVDTTDTGLAAAVSIRAWLYNSDPTASTGVVGGDNAAFSNKRAGFIGSLSGTFRAFSDGGKARLIPDEGAHIIANPVSGGVTVWVQYQVISAAGFTPSANSTTLIGRLKGFQGRA